MRQAILVWAVACASALPVVAEESETRSGIAWFGTWERGARVAKATGRPVLLISAAPQCHGISGLW